MNNYRNIKVPVKRNGTSQRERLPETLLPDYVLVDERSTEDLIRFITESAKNLKYFNLKNEEDGTWEDFFTGIQENSTEYIPHQALLLAFLKLFKLSQDNLNTFTKRHLDFYYEEVLQFNKESAMPGHVHLILELARNVQSYLLKADTLFKAGKDANGKDILYKLDKDTELSQAKVSDVKTVFLKKENFEIEVEKEIDEKKVLTAIELEKVEGVYADKSKPGDTISTLGNNSLPTADIGFAIASPVLLMREGERKITITIEGTFDGNEYWLDHLPPEFVKSDNEEETSEDEIFPPFKLLFSGESEWIESNPSLVRIERKRNQTSIIFTLETVLRKDIAPIVPFNEKNLNGKFKTKWPIVQIVLNSGGSYPYIILKDFILIVAEIIVDVKDVKKLMLQNDFSKLDSNRPFQPFGIQPGVGANFYIGSAEVFQKELESVDIHLKWYDVPNKDLSEHYKGYAVPRNNKDFKVEIGILKNKDWIDLDQPSAIFKTDAREPLIIPITGGNIETDEADSFEELEPYTIDSKQGFIKLSLQDPDFGHKEYPNLYTKAITDINKKVEGAAILPNQPYTPMAQYISLDYSARKEIDRLNAQQHIFHLHPFGLDSYTTLNNTPYLLPSYNDEGNLYIGIKNLHPPCEFSILFQIIEGSSNPDSEKPQINWSYLANDQWILLEGPAIIKDETDSFNSSGIITFSIPAKATNQNQMLPAGEHWLKASAKQNSDGTCILTDIKAQAATVIEIINSTARSTVGEPLAPSSIQKMLIKDASIKNISQPYTSIHGKGVETDKAFYKRVSERLRHKQRALTTWDYERLALEKFPLLYKAKCYKHASIEKGDAPGSVLLIIIPDLRNNPAINTLQPIASLGLQQKVKEFLQKIAPPHIQIEVKNPVFETIHTQFMVKFRKGYNNGFYEQQLQNDLKKFLSPWAYSKGEDITMGGRVYKSSILNFVEKQPYVDYATFFKMDHMDTDGNVRVNVEEAEAISPISILTSSGKHKITVLDNEADLCADGIGHMIIEEAFVTIK